jgi:type 1 glutamine amidotransferase
MRYPLSILMYFEETMTKKMKNRPFLFAIICFGTIVFTQSLWAQTKIKVLNFQADNGHAHTSKPMALAMIEKLGVKNNWDVVTSTDTAIFKSAILETFDVIVFNNNCGNKGRIFSNPQQKAFQNYIRRGGGFVAIHCAAAIWHEGGGFQQWYEDLVGARMVAHPKPQIARLIVENQGHISTKNLPQEWRVEDEWHTYTTNPRERVNVLMSLDETTYDGKPKMGGDHPITWYQNFDGGRSFFTTLGHTEAMYGEDNFQKLIQGGIEWAAIGDKKGLPLTKGLLLDLDADHGIVLEKGDRISSWHNKIKNNAVKSFDKQDTGRVVAGTGMPQLKLNNAAINGHNTVVFHRQELLNDNENAFDHLTSGSGYTWFSVMSVNPQIPGIPNVHSFFGNLRNTNVDKKGHFEGFWGGLSDSNKVWMGSRNGITQGRWDVNNPYVVAPKALEKSKYYLVMGRMASGTGNVKIELFINETTPVAKDIFIVSADVNPSKMAIGQERDATNHPGAESFDGEIARFLIFERNLSDEELKTIAGYLKKKYEID